METSVETKDKKKFYSTPKLEKIGVVRDLTRGANGFNADGATHRNGGPPSDPA